jgi:nucleoside 2-deoxyribosyltransferase
MTNEIDRMFGDIMRTPPPAMVPSTGKVVRLNRPVRKVAPEDVRTIPTPTQYPHTVYLAGKIAQGEHWRSRIVGGDDDHPCYEALDPSFTLDIDNALGKFTVTGPIFVSACGHGLAHRGSTHAACEDTWTCDDEEPSESDRAKVSAMQAKVHAVNTQRIRNADFVFAFIDEDDCFGTLAEIGFAHGIGKPVYLLYGGKLTPKQRADFWFVEQFAARVYRRVNIEHAFNHALRLQALEKEFQLQMSGR